MPGDGRSGDRLDVRSVVYLAGGMACFGSATPLSRIVGRALPVALAAGLRMAVAALVLIPVWLVARRTGAAGPALRTVDTRDRVLLLGIGLIGTVAFTVLMLVGMRHAPGAVGAVVMATTPAVTAMGAVVFLGDRLGPGRIVAVALAVAGVLVVNLAGSLAQGGGDDALLGSALVFGAVCCEAAYSLLGKKLSAQLPPLTITVVATLVALAAFAPVALVQGQAQDWAAMNGADWVAVAWWGLGTMALGSLLWFRGMRRVAPGTAAAFMGVMPVSALVLSYVLLGEPFRWVHVAGMALVLAGLVAVVRSGASVH